MCEPASISLALAAGGTALTAYGQVQAGQAQKSQASYQAQVLRNNEIIANRNAEDAIKRGEIAETRQRQETSRLIGRQRAVLASNGVVVDEGSALDITSETAGFGELDALTIRSNAAREAYNYRVQGQGFGAEAGLMDMRGRAAASAGYMGAASSVLTGAGNVADKWYTYKRQGAWN